MGDQLLICQTLREHETVIIEDTEEGRDQFGHMCGSGNIQLSRAEVQALLNGQCVAFHDGEYSHFLTLKDEDDDN